MAAGIRCLLAAVLFGYATAMLLEQPTRRPMGGVRIRRKDAIERRTIALLQTQRQEAVAYLEKQAIKLNAAELAVLAVRTAKASSDQSNAVSEFRELRGVIHKVIAGGADGVIARLQDFCNGEVKKTGNNLTHFEGLKKKAEAELVQLATKADSWNKRLASLKPGLIKTKKLLLAAKKAAKKNGRSRKVLAKGKHGKVEKHVKVEKREKVVVPKEMSLADVAKLTAKNNAAAKDFLKHLDDQMQEAKDASAWQKERRLKMELKEQRSKYKTQEKDIKALNGQLVTKAQAAQTLEGTVKSLQQYNQQLQTKCGKGKKGQGKEEFEAIQAAYKILSGERQ